MQELFLCQGCALANGHAINCRFISDDHIRAAAAAGQLLQRCGGSSSSNKVPLSLQLASEKPKVVRLPKLFAKEFKTHLTRARLTDLLQELSTHGLRYGFKHQGGNVLPEKGTLQKLWKQVDKGRYLHVPLALDVNSSSINSDSSSSTLRRVVLLHRQHEWAGIKNMAHGLQDAASSSLCLLGNANCGAPLHLDRARAYNAGWMVCDEQVRCADYYTLCIDVLLTASTM